MEQFFKLGSGWDIQPAGGATGEAYVAKFEGNKYFLKRNSSPFLAVLSAEGIVPKLVWTKRMENGDVITAQKWLEGRELKPVDMKSPEVARLLSKIHHSKALSQMLKRIHHIPLHPETIMEELMQHIDADVLEMNVVQRALRFLNDYMESTDSSRFVVCHCDLNHNNWLLSEKEELFLIDWDGARIADPALDLGLLLHWYIPQHEWEEWLSIYGIPLTDLLEKKMKWYVISQTIQTINWHKKKLEHKEMKQWTMYLEQLLKE